MASISLYTFLFTCPTRARSVQLYGSWDNFASPSPLEKDARRGGREWKGCFEFEGALRNEDQDRQMTGSGCLRMGGTYWYYYLVDHESECYDPLTPSTTSCPYLPGQKVNILEVPMQLPTLAGHRQCYSRGSTMAMEDVQNFDVRGRYQHPKPPLDERSPNRPTTSPARIRDFYAAWHETMSKLLPRSETLRYLPRRPCSIYKQLQLLAPSSRGSSSSRHSDFVSEASYSVDDDECDMDERMSVSVHREHSAIPGPDWAMLTPSPWETSFELDPRHVPLPPSSSLDEPLSTTAWDADLDAYYALDHRPHLDDEPYTQPLHALSHPRPNASSHTSWSTSDDLDLSSMTFSSLTTSSASDTDLLSTFSELRIRPAAHIDTVLDSVTDHYHDLTSATADQTFGQFDFGFVDLDPTPTLLKPNPFAAFAQVGNKNDITLGSTLGSTLAAGPMVRSTSERAGWGDEQGGTTEMGGSGGGSQMEELMDECGYLGGLIV